MTAVRNSVRDRRECFEANRQTHPLTGRTVLQCHICKGWIEPAREDWIAEHPTPHANGGTLTLPAHPACHTGKTATDVREIAKGKRTSDRHFNIRRRKGFHRPDNLKFNWASGRYERE
jgi:hypothetical protein